MMKQNIAISTTICLIFITILNATVHADTPSAPPKIVQNNLKMTFVYIPPGEFMMGSPVDESGRDENERQHKVTLTRGFYMQTTEVTQGQWKRIMGDNPSHFAACGDNCPVEMVSWHQAREFVKHLNRAENTDKYRLPTEAEWEYACRAGTTRAFYTGDCLPIRFANYNGEKTIPGCPDGFFRGATAPVASFPANPWGLYDMHGNVWEWCEDAYGTEIYKSDQVDPLYLGNDPRKIFRGGSWLDGEEKQRSADRNRFVPTFQSYYLGFRLAMDAAK